jgi:hypothetical protein
VGVLVGVSVGVGEGVAVAVAVGVAVDVDVEVTVGVRVGWAAVEPHPQRKLMMIKLARRRFKVLFSLSSEG